MSFERARREREDAFRTLEKEREALEKEWEKIPETIEREVGKIVAEADAGMAARVTHAATKVVSSIGTKISEAISVAPEVLGGTNITQEKRDRLYDKIGEIGRRPV